MSSAALLQAKRVEPTVLPEKSKFNRRFVERPLDGGNTLQKRTSILPFLSNDWSVVKTFCRNALGRSGKDEHQAMLQAQFAGSAFGPVQNSICYPQVSEGY